MRKSIIFAIAQNTWKELRHRKALMILTMTFGLGYLAPLFIQLKLISVFSNGSPINQSSFIIAMSELAIFIGLLFSIFYAAGLVQSEANKRTISTVMIRPIYRWEYLLGRVLGVVFLFTIFIVMACICGYAASILTGSHLDGSFALGILQRFCRGIGFILIAASLGSIFSAASTLFILVTIGFFAFVFLSLPPNLHPLLSFISMIFHYATPAKLSVDLIEGFEKVSDSKTSWLIAIAMFENILYGIFIFIWCSWLFEKRDIQLKEE